jgi:hypothetical protein
MTQSVISGNVSCENTLTGITTNGSFDSFTNNVLFANAIAFDRGSGIGNMFRNNKFTNGAPEGVATLVAGTVTVSTVEVRSTDIILLTRSVSGGTTGQLTAGSIVSGTSFQISSSSGSDTSIVYWQIVH